MPEAESSARDSRGTAPTVVFIAGSGRSELPCSNALGATPGYVAIGEALDLPRRVAPADERCGCGEPFSQCPFWNAVGDRLGGWDADALAQMHQLQTQVARQRYLPRLLAGARRGAFAGRLDDYTSRYAALYYAVARNVAGCRTIVDASKWPSLALALHRGGVDVRVIHLVRDVRGVAHSLGGRVERPHTTGRTPPAPPSSCTPTRRRARRRDGWPPKPRSTRCAYPDAGDPDALRRLRRRPGRHRRHSHGRPRYAGPGPVAHRRHHGAPWPGPRAVRKPVAVPARRHRAAPGRPLAPTDEPARPRSHHGRRLPSGRASPAGCAAGRH